MLINVSEALALKQRMQLCSIGQVGVLPDVSEALALKQRMQPDMDIGLNLTKMVSEALALKQRMQLIIMSTVYVATLCLRGTCAETEDATLYQKLLK